MYDFDPYLLYRRLVPWFLRKPIFLSLLQALSTALDFIQGLLLAFVNEIEYTLLFNAQIVYLEHVLNDAFDDVNRLIYIENVFLPSLYIYNEIEAQPPLYIRNASEGEPPLYFRNTEEYGAANQYIVHLPTGLSGQEDAITALIELYNLAGMNYTLVFDL